MPIGQHLARCLNCGKTWIVGDCIPSFCSEECRAGHTAYWNRIEEEYRDKIEVVDCRKETHEADRV